MDINVKVEVKGEEGEELKNKEIDLKASINKMAAILDMIDQFRSPFNSICKYLNEIWDVETFQERLLHEENIFNPTKFYNLHSVCINKLDKFCELVESSVDELEYARKVASGWKDNSSIPENRFSNMSINEDKSSGIINYKEIMQKNCQRITKHREGDHIIPKLPILKETKIHKENSIKMDEIIDNWLLEAKKRPYKVEIEKIEFDSIGRVTGLLVHFSIFQ
ncbi:8603_t:CDS:2 [Diversispora eburnea]|uniref:8603_t:CDS:1 n=1 Tax=Diversispora eburnea TaxID=1213867 RepID=A0A9N9G6L6_9GLOM|nr:8603_t:CDS:2 [Diversispora eburnea]